MATTGADGKLNIYKIVKDERLLHLAKIEICEEKVPDDDSFGLQMQWLTDETLLIAGHRSLGFLSKDEDDEKVWDSCYEERVEHAKVITSII